MKYWNKDKDIRRRCWTKVTHPMRTARWVLNSGDAIFTEYVPADELKQWCQQQASTGRFYHYYGADTWWFEKSQDATHFLLRWA